MASVLAFSAIRNNDRVGLILFSEEVEKYIPPRKGRRHVLRVIREVLLFQPKKRGTNLKGALEFIRKVLLHRSIVVVLSDFLGQATSFVDGKREIAPSLGHASFAHSALSTLRQTNRFHDLVAIQILDRYELELPALGRLLLQDAETGELIEINSNNKRKTKAFAERQARSVQETARLFRSANIDSIQLKTDQPYASALGRFFETREKRRRHG